MLFGLAFVMVGSTSAQSSNLINGECIKHYDPNSHGDVFPAHATGGSEFKSFASSEFSVLWDVEYHSTYKLLVNHLRGEKYVLWQCGTPRPEIDDAAGYFEVPVSRIATTSTTYMPYIEMIGERRSLVAYTSTFDWVSSPCLQKLNRDGDIRVAVNATGDFTLSEDDVDLTIADEWTINQVPKGYSITDTHEETVLQVAEYVEVVGLFFNREAEATAVTERILNAYTCLKDEIRGTSGKKVLFTGYAASIDAFSIATCPRWYCEVITDAGGLVMQFQGQGAVSSWGSEYMSLDQLLDFARDADVIVSAAPLPDYGHPTTTALLDLGIPVFDNQGPLGYNDWWERRLSEPDAVLADLATILWPETYRRTPRNFFRDLTAGEAPGSMVSDDDLDTACPDPDAPYQYLLSAAKDCLDAKLARLASSSNTSSSSSSNSENPTVVVVVVLTVFLSLVAAAFVLTRRRRRQRDRAGVHRAVAVELVALSDDKDDKDVILA